ncbi:MAG: hypothetical protein ABIN58_03985 [candidate division WOR-3 bacterium]
MIQTSTVLNKALSLSALVLRLIATLDVYAATPQGPKPAKITYQHVATIELDRNLDVQLLRVDRGGNLYVVAASGELNSTLEKFAPSGRHLLSVDFEPVVGTSDVSIYDLFIARDGRLYVLAAWSPPDERDVRFGVLIFNRQARFLGLVDLTPYPIFTPTRTPMLAVDSGGSLYLLGLLRRGRRLEDQLVTNNTVHKFSPSGKWIASFSPLTDEFRPEHYLDAEAFQALLIDSQDRLHHIYLSGAAIRTYTSDGRLLKEYRLKLSSVPAQGTTVAGRAMPKRHYFGSFTWGHRLVLSLGETLASGRSQIYTLVVDPFEGSEMVTSVAYPTLPATTIGLDGYAYSSLPVRVVNTGRMSYPILKQRLVINNTK